MPHTVGSELYDAMFPLSDVREMPRVAIALRHLFARPQGAVVQISVPADLLDRRCPTLLDPASLTIAPAAPGAAALAQIAEWLQQPGGPPAFVFGSGAVAYGEKLGELVARMGAVHITTPAALGLLPDSLGLIGTAAEADVAARLRAVGPRCVFVVGTRLGTASGGGDVALLPKGCPVVHVDAAPYEAVGGAPAVRDHPLLSVTSEIGEFIGALDALLPSP
jgi:thiamine pyrophosphate-dependent acetolactate synthase large subunit-like protein